MAFVTSRFTWPLATSPPTAPGIAPAPPVGRPAATKPAVAHASESNAEGMA